MVGDRILNQFQMNALKLMAGIVTYYQIVK